MIIETRHLGRWYGPVVGLTDITVQLGAGIHGVLGPNGAGKTTLLRVLSGQIRPSIGTVKLFGETPWRNLRGIARIGYCPEQDSFYEDLSGVEFVAALLRLGGLARHAATEKAEQAMAEVGLTEVMHRRIATYSRGMRQRVKLAQAFAHDPEVLFLDEPLAGTDPLSRARMVELIRGKGKAGKCILVSSHVLHEVEAMTENILVIARGQLVASGSVYKIREMIDEFPHHIRVRCHRPRDLARALCGTADVAGIEFPDEHTIEVLTHQPDRTYPAIVEQALETLVAVESLTSPDATMEAVFHYLVERGARIKQEALVEKAG